MRILLDNSTITAALRAAGNIRIDRRELFDLDVSSLRVLIDSIILAEEISILDDYKPQFTNERKEILADPSINFVHLAAPLSDAMLGHAKAHVVNWKMHRHLGTELAPMFKDLDIMFQHAWRNSEAFLVLHALGEENKYNSQIVSAFISDRSGLPERTFKRLTPKYYNRETKKVVQSLGWAAVRTVFYRAAAKYIGCEYISHPLRNLMNAKCILFDNHPFTRKTKENANFRANKPRTLQEATEQLSRSIRADSYFNDVNRFFEKFWTDANHLDENIFGARIFDVDMPPFLSFCISRSRDPFDGGGIISTALKIRNEREATSLRGRLKNLYESDEAAYPDALRDFGAELKRLKQYLQTYLGYDRERVSISVKGLSYSQTIPRFMTKPLYPHRPHLALIRDVILELSSVASLGTQHDYLWRNASK